MRSIGILAFIVSILFAGVVTWLNLSWKTIKQFTNETSQSRIDYYLSNFTLINTDQAGNISYQLSAEHLIHKQASGASEIYRPKIKKQSVNGDLLTINAEKAMTGVGFETKLDEQELRILSNVQAEFQPSQ